MVRRTHEISKLLSPNDTGESGTHQAGVLVPKNPDILGFFPDLGNSEKNPRVSLVFEDESGQSWTFSFIYYNNRFFAEKGTRNEYRLTGMTAYLRESNAHAGDTLILSRSSDGDYSIRLRKPTDAFKTVVGEDGRPVIHITASSSWKVISI